MESKITDEEMRYFDEVALQLRKAGYSISDDPPNSLLAVEWNGIPLCQVTPTGGIRYRAADVRLHNAEAAYERAFKIASTTAEYMRQMETAPALRASGLEGDYRVLAEFNGTVLAGHPTKYGVQFITWDWGFERQGLYQGNYFECDGYEAAKQDFATRSCLVSKDCLFTQEQLSDIYRAVDFLLSMSTDVSYKEDQRLNEVLEQIERILPEVDLRQMNGPGIQMGGMT